VSEEKEIENLETRLEQGYGGSRIGAPWDALALCRRLLQQRDDEKRGKMLLLKDRDAMDERIASLERQHAAIRLEQAEKMVSIWTNETSSHRNGLGLIAERDRLKREVTRDSEKREEVK